jgi:hypothetical protein
LLVARCSTRLSTFDFDLRLLERSHNFRRQHPAEIAWTSRGDLFDVDTQHRTFLELDRMTRSDEARRQFADTWLVTNQRNPRLADVLLEIRESARRVSRQARANRR